MNSAKRADAEALGAQQWYRDILKEKIREALRGTSNKSAPGPVGVSYRLIKLATKGPLGDALLD